MHDNDARQGSHWWTATIVGVSKGEREPSLWSLVIRARTRDEATVEAIQQSWDAGDHVSSVEIEPSLVDWGPPPDATPPGTRTQ